MLTAANSSIKIIRAIGNILNGGATFKGIVYEDEHSEGGTFRHKNGTSPLPLQDIEFLHIPVDN